jgi:hypothetical protein
MSVSLDKTKEVLFEKIKAHLAKDGLDTDDRVSIDNLGELYEDVSWGSFNKENGIEVANSFGGEDQGSRYGYVLKFEVDGNTVYLELTGHYDSWNGVDWAYGDVRLVTPVTKTVVVYE